VWSKAFSQASAQGQCSGRCKVTRAPSFSWAPLRCSLLGLGGSRGDGLVRSLVEGLHDTTAPGFAEAADWQQGDAP